MRNQRMSKIIHSVEFVKHGWASSLQVFYYALLDLPSWFLARSGVGWLSEIRPDSYLILAGHVMSGGVVYFCLQKADARQN